MEVLNQQTKERHMCQVLPRLIEIVVTSNTLKLPPKDIRGGQTQPRH